VNQIAVGASPLLLLATPDGKRVLVVSQGPGELYILDPAAGTVSAHLAVGDLPHWIALTPDGRRAWVTNEGSNDVSLVDLRRRFGCACRCRRRTAAFQPAAGAREVLLDSQHS
jgi:YVTN family beta-propeller protein